MVSSYYGYINLIAEDEWPQRAAPSDLGSIYCGTILFITFKVPPVSVRHQADYRAVHAAHAAPLSLLWAERQIGVANT